MFCRNRWLTLALAAHEYGHSLLTVAKPGQIHLRSASRYCIMQGNIRPASLEPSGWLRYKLGWIDPPVEIDLPSKPVGFDTTFALSTSYADDEAFAIIRTQKADQYFLLEAKQWYKTGEAYNRPQPADEPACDGDVLTATTFRGLLATHIYEGGWTLRDEPELPPGVVPVIDIEVATGEFDEGDWTPDPVAGRDSIDTNWQIGGFSATAADLFFPPPSASALARTSVMAPWTNPSTDLYRNDGTDQKDWQDVYSGLTLYNVEFFDNNDSMRVSLHYDGTTEPAGADTVRHDVKLQGLVQVMNDVVFAPGTKTEFEEGAMIVAAGFKMAGRPVWTSRVWSSAAWARCR